MKSTPSRSELRWTWERAWRSLSYWSRRRTWRGENLPLLLESVRSCLASSLYHPANYFGFLWHRWSGLRLLILYLGAFLRSLRECLEGSLFGLLDVAWDSCWISLVGSAIVCSIIKRGFSWASCKISNKVEVFHSLTRSCSLSISSTFVCSSCCSAMKIKLDGDSQWEMNHNPNLGSDISYQCNLLHLKRMLQPCHGLKELVH